MGAAFFVILDNKDPGFDTFMNGKSLAAAMEGLGEIAAISGLSLLEEYVSQSPEEAAAIAEELGVPIDLEELPPVRWYSPEEGLKWATAMKHMIEKDGAGLENPTGVLSDLREMTDLLEKAAAIGAKWHLAVDF